MPKNNLFKIGVATAAAAVGAVLAITSVFAHSAPATSGHSIVGSIVKAEVPLEQAIIKVEALANAPAIDAGVAKPLSGTNAVLAYFVETAKGKSRGHFAVDAMTGAFVELVEADLFPFGRRRKQGDRTRDEGQLEVAFPVRTRGHGSTPYSSEPDSTKPKADRSGQGG